MENKRVKHDQSVGAEPLVNQAGSSKPTNDETGRRNPLLMEDILDNVFKYINNTEDIRNLRLVCKTWRLSATRTKLLSDLPLVFPPKPYYLWYDRVNVAQFRRFLDTMDNSELLPFKNYTISSNVLITHETKEKDEGDLLGDFFRICGPDVISLNLYLWCKVGRKLKLPKEVKVGKLKELNLDIKPGLLNRQQISHLQEFYLLAGLILDSASMLQKLEYSFDDMLLKNLTDRGLQLNELKLVYNVQPKSMEESETIQKFLETQTATLHRLELWGRPVKNLSCNLTLPMFHNLVHLKFGGSVKIAPFVVGEICPKLRSLDVMFWNTGIFSGVFIKKKPSTTLKVLWLSWSFPSVQIKNLSLDYPLITELHLGRNSIIDVLEQVFIHFPLLQHLELQFPHHLRSGSFSIDAILCGIPMDVCKRIIRLPLSEFRNLNLSELQQKPSIINLALLQKLEFMNYGGDGPSDISAQFGFLRMPNLKELIGYKCLFSTAYIEALQERIPKFNFLEMDYPPYRDLEEEDSYEEEQDTEDGETDMEDN